MEFLINRRKNYTFAICIYVCMHVHVQIDLKFFSLVFLHSVLSSNILDNFLLIAKYSVVKYRDNLRF